MTDSPILILGDPRLEEWMPVAHRYGEVRMMNHARFPVCNSYDEVIERIRIMEKIDPAWARKWADWHKTGMRVDGQVSP